MWNINEGEKAENIWNENVTLQCSWRVKMIYEMHEGEWKMKEAVFYSGWRRKYEERKYVMFENMNDMKNDITYDDTAYVM